MQMRPSCPASATTASTTSCRSRGARHSSAKSSAGSSPTRAWTMPRTKRGPDCPTCELRAPLKPDVFWWHDCARSAVAFSRGGTMRLASGAVAACAAACAVSLSAHHSHGQYEETFTDIEGVVKELHLLVPHSWIYLEVKDAAGTPQLW